MCDQFCDNCKILSFGHHLKEVEIKITYSCPVLRVSQKSEKNLRVYIVLGDAVSMANLNVKIYSLVKEVKYFQNPFKLKV